NYRQRNKISLELLQLIDLRNRDISCRNREVPSPRHGVTRINRDIYERQLEFRNVNLNRPDILRYMAFQLNVPAQRANQHFTNGIDSFLQTDDNRTKRLSSRDGQELTRQAFPST